MAQLRIHCGYCKGTWDVYGREDWRSERSRTCPHCNSKIDGQTWEKQILPAFGSMMDANRELMNDHTGYNQPLFAVDFIEDHVFMDSVMEATAAAGNLQESVDELRDIVETLANAIITNFVVNNEMQRPSKAWLPKSTR